MRLGDLDAFEEKLKSYLGGQAIGFLLVGALRNEPTIDAVEVVRCKDCRKADKKTRVESSLYVEECLICTEWPNMRKPMMPDGFCSQGKRKDGDG